jgi:hypothetical protein
MHTKPWPFNKVPKPRPADWGIGMTVCIVSHCFQSRSFVAVADSMLSMPDMSADKLANKSFSIGNYWLCMFSANDMSPVVSISNTVRDQLVGEDSTLEEVISAFQLAFRKELVAKAESSILASFGMTMAEFRTVGLTSFGAEIFSRLFYQRTAFARRHIFSLRFRQRETTHFYDSKQGRNLVFRSTWILGDWKWSNSSAWNIIQFEWSSCRCKKPRSYSLFALQSEI